jgi:hypothetical protein
VAAKHAADFANVRLLTVEEVFGGWGKVQAEHLANGGHPRPALRQPLTCHLLHPVIVHEGGRFKAAAARS